MEKVIEVRHYVTRAGKDVFDDWLSQLADARAQAKLRVESTGSPRGTLETASRCAKVYASCGLIGDPAIGFTTRRSAGFACCFCAAATNENSRQISTGR